MSTTDECKPRTLYHLGYLIVTGWSTKDQCYKAYTPEWREDIIQPCAQGDTYEEVCNKAKEVLELFDKAANGAQEQ